MRRNKNVLYLLFLIGVFTLSIGYALINKTVFISGNSEVSKNTWDLHFENIELIAGSTNSGSIPIIDDSGLSVSFSTTLNVPGDFYGFTIDVVNSGTIDAMIDSIIKTPELTDSQKKYINYVIEYQNDESINKKQIVSKDSLVKIKVRVEYKKDITESDLPTEVDNLGLGFTLNFVQADVDGIKVNNNGVTKVKIIYGSLDINESEFCINNECFYIISNDSDSITAFAKYNLHVGNKYDQVTYLPIENPTNKQDLSAKGWFEGFSTENPVIGVKEFSKINYWDSYTTIYPSYVYNSNSYLYEYINNYKIYLENLGVTVSDARLISLDELESLGCSIINNRCDNAPDWVYSISYWTGNVNSSTEVWRVLNTASLNYYSYTIKYYGIRPVVVFSKEKLNAFKPIIEFTINGDLYEAESDMSWTTWLDSKYNTLGFKLVDGEIKYLDKYLCVDTESRIRISGNYNLFDVCSGVQDGSGK